MKVAHPGLREKRQCTNIKHAYGKRCDIIDTVNVTVHLKHDRKTCAGIIYTKWMTENVILAEPRFIKCNITWQCLQHLRPWDGNM